MDISPISRIAPATSATRPLRPEHESTPAPAVASIPVTPVPAASADAASPQGDGVVVEIAKHPGTGAQTVSIVDGDSGEVLSQIPPEQVLDLVAALIAHNEANQRRGSSDGQR